MAEKPPPKWMLYLKWLKDLSVLISFILAVIAALVTIGVIRSFEDRTGEWPQGEIKKVQGSWCTDAYKPYYSDAMINFTYENDIMLFSQSGFGSDIDHKLVQVELLEKNGGLYFKYPESNVSLTSINVVEDKLYRDRWVANPSGDWTTADSSGADMYYRCGK